MKQVCVLGALAAARAMPSIGHAKAPTGRFVVDAKGETVHDTWGKRTWQRVVDSGSYTWAKAKAHCTGLTRAGGGWRLPDVRELESIVDRQQKEPAIEPMAFPATPAVIFWSATALSGSSSNVWVVNFYYGHSNLNLIAGPSRVRCVR